MPDLDVIKGFQDFVSHGQAYSYAVQGSSGEDKRAFVPVQTIEKHFTDDAGQKLTEILDAVFPEDPPVYASEITPRYTAVFSILLHIGRGQFIEEFIKYSSLCDIRLPFTSPPADFPLLHEEPSFFIRFCKEQWRFCAPEFQRHMHDEHFEPDRVLPITYRDKLAGGGSATTYKIQIHRLFNGLLSNDLKANRSEKTAKAFYVLKTYITQDARTYYHNEVTAFRRLKPTPNIIGFLGSYRHGDTFNVLLEYADKGSLENYFKEETVPRTGEDVMKLWRSILQLGKALVCIHEVEPRAPTKGPSIFQGWHQDVKPDNILIVSNDEPCPYNWQFKLADLGLSHFKRGVVSSEDPTACDTYGTRTYGAPECYRRDAFIEERQLKVKQNVDIWSLGCVYSEVARWLAGGYAGVIQYRAERKAETDKIRGFRDGDCFHNGTEALAAVKASHRKTRASLGWQDFITELVIDRMIKPMLEVSDGRPTAMQSWITSMRILEEAQEQMSKAKMERGARDNPRSQNPPPPPHLPPDLRLPNDLRLPSDARRFEPSGNIITRDRFSRGSEPNSGRFDPQNWGGKPQQIDNPEDILRQGGKSAEPADNGSYSGGALEDRNHDTYLGYDPRRASGFGGVEAGIPQNNTDGPNRPSHSQRIRHSEASPEPTSTGPVTPSRPPALISASAPQVSRTQAAHIDDHRPSSVPNAALKGQPPTPESPTPAYVTAIRKQNESDASSSQSSQTRQPSAQVDVRPEEPKEELPVLSVKDALAWVAKRKRGSHEQLPDVEYLERLKKRDHVFLIDDSRTMVPHWRKVKEVLEALSYIVKDCDPDGTEVYFTISSQTKRSRDPNEMVRVLEGKSLRGSTDINIRLKEILEKYGEALEKYKDKLSKGPSRIASLLGVRLRPKKVRPLNLYVLTNGIWESKSSAEGPILSLVAKLVDLGMDKSQVGIQFISFGDNIAALAKLDVLDSGLRRGREKWLDIVDTTPSQGNVWKMLLGAINDTFDDDDDDEEEGQHEYLGINSSGNGNGNSKGTNNNRRSDGGVISPVKTEEGCFPYE